MTLQGDFFKLLFCFNAKFNTPETLWMGIRDNHRT